MPGLVNRALAAPNLDKVSCPSRRELEEAQDHGLVRRMTDGTRRITEVRDVVPVG